MITTVDIKNGKITQRELTPEEIAALPVKTEEEIAAEAREQFKQSRAEAVSQIVVEVVDQLTGDVLLFDGDEVAQTRMTRAALVMNDEETTTWVQANNIPTEVTKAQLTEAIRLAGAEQTRLWVMPVINPNTEEEVTARYRGQFIAGG